MFNFQFWNCEENFPIKLDTPTYLLSTSGGGLTLHITPTYLLTWKLEHIRWGIDITHTPLNLETWTHQVGRYWHYTYPPRTSWLGNLSTSGGGVLTLHIPPSTYLLAWKLEHIRWGYWHYTYPHLPLDLETSAHQVGVLTLHIPPPPTYHLIWKLEHIKGWYPPEYSQ